MKALRWSPVSPLVLASALQVFIFSCCLLISSCDTPLDDRQVDMNDLRSAPVTPLALASAAHSFIFSCWLFRCGDCAGVVVCASASGPAMTASVAPKAARYVETLIPSPLRTELTNAACYLQARW